MIMVAGARGVFDGVAGVRGCQVRHPALDQQSWLGWEMQIPSG
jgi:hypothetical protein